MSFDPITMAMSKGKIFKLSDYGISLMAIMQSGQKSVEQDCSAFVRDIYNTMIVRKRLAILHADDGGTYIAVSSANNGQVTGTLTGGMGDGTYIKADFVIMADGIALFTSMLT